MSYTEFDDKDDLTGRFRFRTGSFNKVVLQVEHRFPSRSSPGVFYGRWRDATTADLLKLNFKDTK